MLELRNLYIKAGNFRLKNISLKVEEGSFHVIVGPTGSGKTLLLETILGMRQPLSGEILKDGIDITNFPQNRRDMAYLPQDLCLFQNMTVEENIFYASSAKKLDIEKVEKLAAKFIKLLRIEHILKRYPEDLSGGEKQRVALIRCLAAMPSLVILDEPFSFIDVPLREEAQRMLKVLYEEAKITTLMVTHDFDEAFFLADDITVLIKGQIAESGEPARLYNFPHSYETAKFLGFRNIFKGEVLHIGKKHLIVSLDGANQSVRINCKCPTKFSTGQKIMWGIRAEAIKILNNNKECQDGIFKSNMLTAIIKRIYIRGLRHTLILKIHNSDINIETDMFCFKAVTEYQTDETLSIYLPEDRIFTITLP